MNKRVLSAAAAAAFVLSLATGCGGSDRGGRPSVDEIADGIQGGSGALGEVDDKIANCVAKAFHDSDLSDDALQAIADSDKDYKPSKDDEKALTTVSSDSVAKCADVDLPDTDTDN